MIASCSSRWRLAALAFGQPRPTPEEKIWWLTRCYSSCNQPWNCRAACGWQMNGGRWKTESNIGEKTETESFSFSLRGEPGGKVSSLRSQPLVTSAIFPALIVALSAPSLRLSLISHPTVALQPPLPSSSSPSMSASKWQSLYRTWKVILVPHGFFKAASYNCR